MAVRGRGVVSIHVPQFQIPGELTKPLARNKLQPASMPASCVVCGITHNPDDLSLVPLHRFPSNAKRRQLWLEALGMAESELQADPRVCRRHFSQNCYRAGSQVLLSVAVPNLKLQRKKNVLPASVPGTSTDKEEKEPEDALLEASTSSYNLQNFEVKGLAIIYFFTKFLKQPPLTCNARDAAVLEEAYLAQGLRVETHKNLTKKNLQKSLSLYLAQDLSEYGCVIITILSHGDTLGRFESSDKTCHLSMVWSSFTQNSTLRKKAKVFHLSMCRGPELDEVQYVEQLLPVAALPPDSAQQAASGSGAGQAPTKSPLHPGASLHLPHSKDVLVLYATCERFIALGSTPDDPADAGFLAKGLRDDPTLDMVSQWTRVTRQVIESTQQQVPRKKKKYFTHTPSMWSSLRFPLQLSPSSVADKFVEEAYNVGDPGSDRGRALVLYTSSEADSSLQFEQTLQSMGLDVELRQVSSMRKVRDVLSAASRSNFTGCQLFFVAILVDGKDSYIHNRLLVDVRSWYGASQCPTLALKPKVFMVVHSGELPSTVLEVAAVNLLKMVQKTLSEAIPSVPMAIWGVNCCEVAEEPQETRDDDTRAVPISQSADIIFSCGHGPGFAAELLDMLRSAGGAEKGLAELLTEIHAKEESPLAGIPQHFDCSLRYNLKL